MWTYVLPVLVSGGLYVLYQTAVYLYYLAVFRFSVTLTITTDDAVVWLHLQSYIGRHLEKEARDWVVDRAGLAASYTPLPMSLPFEGKVIRLYIGETPPSSMTISQNGPPKTRRSATLRAYGADAAFFRRFLQFIKLEHMRLAVDTVEFHLPSLYDRGSYAQWEMNRVVRRRPFATLTLDDALRDTMMRDLDHFVNPATRTFYRAHGIPYRRGWLLHGTPGNGKSSIIIAVASYLGCSVHRLMLQGLDDSKLARLMVGAQESDPPYILLLEDIDCLFADRVASKDTGGSVTFSGLLNALDGVGSPENALVIMTTNHPERLDKALLRPGRVDRVFQLDPPTDGRIGTHYRKFFPAASLDDEAAFVRRCRADNPTCSMAMVQGVIMQELAENGS